MDYFSCSPLVLFIYLFIIPTLFLKKRRGYCSRLRPSGRPSVCPSRYLLLNHWTKSNQIWCVSCSHKWGAQRRIFLTRPLGPWGGAKGQISINIIKFQRFLNQTLCVFSQMKGIKHIRRDFYLAPLGHDPGVGIGGTMGCWGSIFFSEIQPDLVCELLK